MTEQTTEQTVLKAPVLVWVAALDLYLQLVERLVGKPHPGVLPSKPWASAIVIDVELPVRGEDFARWWFWRCKLRDENETWEESLYNCIPWTELCLLFREAFVGIDMPLKHPRASSYLGTYPESAAEGRFFRPSGRTVVVTQEHPAMIRPIGDAAQSVWLNAELCVVTDKTRFDATNGDLVATCNVDPFALGQSRGELGSTDYQYLCPSGQPTFYIEMPGFGDGNYFPLARLMTFDPVSGEATFELDQSVTEAEAIECRPVASESDIASFKNMLDIPEAMVWLLGVIHVALNGTAFGRRRKEQLSAVIRSRVDLSGVLTELIAWLLTNEEFGLVAEASPPFEADQLVAIEGVAELFRQRCCKREAWREGARQLTGCCRENEGVITVRKVADIMNSLPESDEEALSLVTGSPMAALSCETMQAILAELVQRIVHNLKCGFGSEGGNSKGRTKADRPYCNLVYMVIKIELLDLWTAAPTICVG